MAAGVVAASGAASGWVNDSVTGGRAWIGCTVRELIMIEVERLGGGVRTWPSGITTGRRPDNGALVCGAAAWASWVRPSAGPAAASIVRQSG
ncbi:MAG: hypothetical protein EXQ88_00435 [Alphaproteobacteria bacterium]|nr:hypothetical protein [Alphaproteobacteria bacterium]